MAGGRTRRSRRARSACSPAAAAATWSSGRAASRGRTSRRTSAAARASRRARDDALRAYALRAARAGGAAACPDLLLMLGDQIYADQPSPALQRACSPRASARPARPRDELADFSEYALAYREAWTDPAIRWLLSTVPVAMIFDDHEIHAEWRISQGWLDEMNAEPWFDDHIRAGLMAYWVFQHLGNLSPAELAEGGLYDEVRSAGDAGALLASRMDTEGRQVGHSRWSYARDLGDARLVVIDSRAGRQVDPRPARAGPGRGVGLDPRAGAEAGPAPAARELGAVPPGARPAPRGGLRRGADRGAWGRLGALLGEKLRRLAVMDHWASFQRTFRKLVDLLDDIAHGRVGERARSIVMLSGDVHHCYLAEVGFRDAARSRVWQAVCSAFRKELAPRRSASSRSATRSSRSASRAASHGRAGVPPLPLDWRVVERPAYANQVATLTLDGEHASLVGRGGRRRRLARTRAGAGVQARPDLTRRHRPRRHAPHGRSGFSCTSRSHGDGEQRGEVRMAVVELRRLRTRRRSRRPRSARRSRPPSSASRRRARSPLRPARQTTLMSAATSSPSRASRASTGPRRRTAMASFVRHASRMPTVGAVHHGRERRIQHAVEPPLEAVEDQVEPELELGGEAVAGRRDVPGDHLEGVRVARRPRPGSSAAPPPPRRPRACRATPAGPAPAARSRRCSVLDRVGVGRLREREARLAQAVCSTASCERDVRRARASSAPPSGRSPRGGGAAPRGSRPPAGASPCASRRPTAAARSPRTRGRRGRRAGRPCSRRGCRATSPRRRASLASRRMLSDSTPVSSASANAASSTRSRLSGTRVRRGWGRARATVRFASGVVSLRGGLDRTYSVSYLTP